MTRTVCPHCRQPVTAGRPAAPNPAGPYAPPLCGACHRPLYTQRGDLCPECGERLGRHLPTCRRAGKEPS